MASVSFFLQVTLQFRLLPPRSRFTRLADWLHSFDVLPLKATLSAKWSFMRIAADDRVEPTLPNAAPTSNDHDAQKADFANFDGRPRANLKRLGTYPQSQPVSKTFAATRKICPNAGLENGYVARLLAIDLTLDRTARDHQLTKL